MVRYTGNPASPGVAIGKIYKYTPYKAEINTPYPSRPRGRGSCSSDTSQIVLYNHYALGIGKSDGFIVSG